MDQTKNAGPMTEAASDVAPLAWLVGEIRSTAQAAASGVLAFLAEKSNVDALREARNQVHLANGALRMLDLRGVSLLLDTLEQLLAFWSQNPRDCLPDGVRKVDAALDAVVAYLEGLLAGRPDQPIRLFPYYRDLLALTGAARVHPADLMFPDLTRRPAFHTIGTRPLTSDQLRVRRAHFEGALLGFLRDPNDRKARRGMRDALADLEKLPQRGLARSFWWVVRGLLDALEADALAVDVDLKRVLARVNLQLRRLIEGGGAVAERLLVDTLYYVGRADARIARVAEARRLYGLDALLPTDFERATLTTLDTDQLGRLREALTQAKTVWGNIAAGNDERKAFGEQLHVARSAAQRLELAPIDTLLAKIHAVADKHPTLSLSIREVVSIEIATALLFVDLGVDELPNLDPRFAGRATAMAARLDAASAGADLPEIESWLSDLARKAQDRLTMQTVVAEMQGTLREIEQRLDVFFRDPVDRAELPAVDGMFEQLTSVLSLLGFDEGVAALGDARQAIRRYSDPAKAADEADFARLAGNLGAIGFLVETLSQDAERPRGMFRWDAARGVFSADIASRTPTRDADFDDELGPRTAIDGASVENVETLVAEHLAQARELAQRLAKVHKDVASAHQLETVLARLSNDADLLDDAVLKQRANNALLAVKQLLVQPDAILAAGLPALLAEPRDEPVAAPSTTAPLPQNKAAADAELLEIFVEEANEVLDSIESSLAELQVARRDKALLTTLRRGFHTLKGSSRMVGLNAFGEGAWAIEQCCNAWLAQEKAADDALLGLASASQQLMRTWIKAIAADVNAPIDPQPLIAAAQDVRDGKPFALEQPVAAAAVEPRVESSAVTESLERELIDIATPEDLPSASESTAAAAAQLEEDTPIGTPAFSEFELPDLELPALDAGPTPEDPPELAQVYAEAQSTDDGDEIRRIGPVAISHGLFSVFLSEADESVRALSQDVAEWRFEPKRGVSEVALRRAHSLAGITATVGLDTVSQLADPIDQLMQTLNRLPAHARPTLVAAQFDVLDRVIERTRGMLHQFAAGIYPPAASDEAVAARELVAYVRAYGSMTEPNADLRSAAAPTPEERSLEEATTIVLVPDEDAPPADSDEFKDTVPFSKPDESTPARAVADENDAALAPSPVENEAAARSAVETHAPGAEQRAPATEAAPRATAAPASPKPVEVEARVQLPAVVDDLDADLLPVFIEEGRDLLPQVAASLRELTATPHEREPARALMRQLHTVKGSARMAGAMRLGEVVHEMETRIEGAMQLERMPPSLLDDLQSQYDQAMVMFEALERGESIAAPAQPARPERSEPATAPAALPSVPASVQPSAEAAASTPVAAAPTTATAPSATNQFVRVRADVLDKLVDQAGEVLIARSRVENQTATLKSALSDLTDNTQRLRAQLRELEIQAEAQIQARSGTMSKDNADFDPLEFDRFTRLQELTRMISESVEDVATVQNAMLKGVQTTESDLSAQFRLTRELQQQLMSVRLVPFATLSERLYRVARQAAKELDKRVNVDIRGGSAELDRVVLERMAGPFEHLLRNAIVHGIEAPSERRAFGKPEAGELRIEVQQEANEIRIVVADDGGGLNLQRIRERGESRGLIRPGAQPSDRELMELIFQPGFSTAAEVTELAGRGVGMDVVREELGACGGRIAVTSEAGRGTRFTLNLPLTLSVTQVVLAKVGSRRHAIPSGMVQQVRRFRPEEVAGAIADGFIEFPEVGQVALRSLAQLVGEETLLHHGRQIPIALLRSGDDQLAVLADEISSNQEVVIKNVGAHVARLTGILGATILGNGEIALIVNPVQLIVRAPEPPRLAETTTALPSGGAQGDAAVTLALAPVIMVVDDSLTVRRVTQRLLERSGYEVVLAKDGVDALRQLQDTQPDVMLVDIEMPRMDGYDLTRNIRGSALTRDIPIIMITSRTADKHRRMALELGVNEYLGKPYQEEELLHLVKRYSAQRVAA